MCLLSGFLLVHLWHPAAALSGHLPSDWLHHGLEDEGVQGGKERRDGEEVREGGREERGRGRLGRWIDGKRLGGKGGGREGARLEDKGKRLERENWI